MWKEGWRSARQPCIFNPACLLFVCDTMFLAAPPARLLLPCARGPMGRESGRNASSAVSWAAAGIAGTLPVHVCVHNAWWWKRAGNSRTAGVTLVLPPRKAQREHRRRGEARRGARGNGGPEGQSPTRAARTVRPVACAAHRGDRRGAATANGIDCLFVCLSLCGLHYLRHPEASSLFRPVAIDNKGTAPRARPPSFQSSGTAL